MPFSGDSFARIYNFVTDAAGSISAQPNRFDGEFDGVATGLSQVKALTTLSTTYQAGSSVALSGGATGLTVSGTPIVFAAGIMTGTFTLAGTLALGNGGTGGVTAAAARANLAAAALGANSDITSLITSTALVESGAITATTLGFRGLPSNPKTAPYTFALTDNGKCIPNTTGGWIIPANASIAFPVGVFVSGYNDSGSAQTLSITADTMTFAGVGTTGSRTIVANGVFTAWKKTATEWIVWGTGLS